MAEAEQANLPCVAEVGAGVKPFWRAASRVARAVSGLRAGDEIRESRNPPEPWRMITGRAGVSLVRNGELVFTPVTMTNAAADA